MKHRLLTTPARRMHRLAVGLALFLTLGLTPTQSGAQSPIQRANDLYATISQVKRSDLVLLPPLAEMDTPPASALAGIEVELIPAGGRDWEALEAWATAGPQKAALAALQRATTETPGEYSMAFGLPYGIEATNIDLIQAGTYVELGDPPLLANAQFKYMDFLDNLLRLVDVEVTRLAAAGDFEGAVDLLVRQIYLGRQMADRGFAHEVRWGMMAMIDGLQRLRDVAYTDSRSTRPKLTAIQLKGIIDRLDDEANFFRIDRIRFPRADLYAAQQVFQTVFTERGGPNDQFTPIMSNLSSGLFPLRQFAEAGRWEQIKLAHKDWFDTKKAVDNVHGDWVTRWNFPAFDDRFKLPFDYDKLDPIREAVAKQAYSEDGKDLFTYRQLVRTEIHGTRTALAILGYHYHQNSYPATVFSTRPTFVKEVDDDPFNPNRAFGNRPEFFYFVPNGPNAPPRGIREEPRPYTINVITHDGTNFSVRLNSDQFILYSVGPDGRKDWAVNVQEDVLELFSGDYLIWPPIPSLHRQHLIQQGQLR